MNREMKRMMQRQGQVGPDGSPAPPRERRPQQRPNPAAAQRNAVKRTNASTFLREVRSELRKVAWPTRAEVLNYSFIVLLALVVLTSLIFGLDYAFAKLSLALFNT